MSGLGRLTNGLSGWLETFRTRAVRIRIVLGP